MIFKDRRDAGRELADVLKKFKGAKDVIILALPRGGVAVAFEVANKLNLPLDLITPRKIGAPGNPEFAIGAISEEGEGIFDEEAVAMTGAGKDYINKEIFKEKAEAKRRLKIYRGELSPLQLSGKTALIIDDGIATGLTMRAAIQSAKKRGAARVIVAAPVAASDSLELIKKEADEVICLDEPVFFGAVGAFYENFGQTEDEEVIELMEKAESFSKK